MHVVCVSYYFDRVLATAEDLLARYHTLTGWAEGLAAAGARVSVVQRFHTDAEVTLRGVRYYLVRDPSYRAGSLVDPARRVNTAVARLRPDVVHANGLAFARQAARLKRLLPDTPLLLQDHAGPPPARRLSRLTIGAALQRVDAVSFAAREQACPWIEAGLLPAHTAVFALMEGSSRFRLQARATARRHTGLTGRPLCLWVGRLDANKDPLTVLQGFGEAAAHLPEVHLAMVYDEAELLGEVKAWLAEHPAAAARVRLLGRLPHAALEAIYNSADFLLLGSHHEGSGYAVLEALSCGVVPIVTDIPSFRVLTANGELGGIWPVGDASALAQTLLDFHARSRPDTPHQVRAYFETYWSFEAIGRQALAAYRSLIRRPGI